MTKRFSVNASETTRSLGEIQRRLARARKQVQVLEAEERGYKAFLLDFYEQGDTLVDYPDGRVLKVHLNEYDMFYMDQARVEAFYQSHGKKVPYAKTVVTKLTVTQRKN